MTKCKHNVDEHPGVECAFCHPCRFHDWPVKATCPKCAADDEYAPSMLFGKQAKDKTFWENVEEHGAKYWYTQSFFWSEKFIALEKEMRKMRKGKGL